MTSYAGVRLAKDAVYTVVSPAVPAVPAVPSIAFRMYATPPPLGYTYRQLSGARPNDLPSFLGWSQLMLAPTQYTQAQAGYEFRSLAQLAGQAIPPGSTAVYEAVGLTTQLVGYSVPVFRSAPLPPQYWGPITNMEYVQFLDAPAYGANGYPIGPGPYTGEFFVPTTTGLLRVVRTYTKDGRGVWMPTSTTPAPPYCRTEGSCRVTALIGFPGRSAVAAQPEVRTRDARLGWNAGANSIGALDGDIRLSFPATLSGPAAIGWANLRPDPTAFRSLSHAFYFDQNPDTAALRVSCMEDGRVRYVLGDATPGDTYELRRVAGAVVYKINGTTVYSSSAYSGGAVRAGAALYVGEDAIGEDLVFEQLSGGATTTPLAPASGRAEIMLRGFAFGPSLAELGGAGYALIEFVHGDADATNDTPAFAAIGYAEYRVAPGYAYGTGAYPDAVSESEIYWIGFGYETPNIGLGRIGFVAFGLGDAMGPQTVFDDTEALLGGIGVEAGTASREIAALRATIAAAAMTAHQATSKNRIADDIMIGSAVAQVVRELIASGLTAEASTTQTYIALSRMADALVFSGAVADAAEAMEVVLAALGLADAGISAVVNASADTFSVEALATATAIGVGQLADAFTLGLSGTATATAGIVLASGVSASDALSGTGEGTNTLRSDLDFALRFAIDNGEYVAWVMNTESKGLTRYTNYPFNSFMKVGGRYYGATDTGIYALEGDDDAGEEIQFAMRLGANAFGTQKYKRMPTFYVGFRADGDLLLKAVVSDSVDGERVAHAYRLKSTNAQNMRDGRRPIGRGLEAIYWDFVIENIDGADVEIDVVEMLPMVLSKRVRGDSGGAS